MTGGPDARDAPVSSRASAASSAASDGPLDAPLDPRVESLSYFFPAHDEAGNVEALVEEALESLPRLARRFEIICIDDGSSDGTGAIADRLAEAHPLVVRAVHHSRNQGYGAAVHSGLSASRYALVCFTDGDRQFRVADLGRLLRRLGADGVVGEDGASEEGRARGGAPDVVVGYRIERADTPLRLAYARLYRLCLRFFFGLRVRDPDCACKVFRRQSLEGLRVESRGAFLSAEMLIKIGARGGFVAEEGVPHYPRTTGRASGADPRVVLRAVRDFWLLRLRMWLDRDGALLRGEPVVGPTIEAGAGPHGEDLVSP